MLCWFIDALQQTGLHRNLSISSWTVGMVVAVKAITGRPQCWANVGMYPKLGLQENNTLSWFTHCYISHVINAYLNDFQVAIRCASSIAVRPIFRLSITCRKKADGLPLLSKNFSGVTQTRSNCPCLILVSMLVSRWLVPRKVARIPCETIFSHWSFIRLIVGIITTVSLFVTREGIWKQRFLPDPVGCSTNVFLPSSTAWMIFSCHGLKVLRL